MGKYKRVFMLVGAVILAAVVALVIATQVSRAKRGVESQLVEVAVSKVDLKGGTVITKEMITTNKFLRNSVPSQCFTDPSKLVGRVLVTPVADNVPISESNLAPNTLKTGGVSAIVGSEKRAMAIRVDKIIGVAGFVHPNNRVDVLVTLRNIAGCNFPVTKTILENILVLAVGPDIVQKGKEEKATPVDVVTLEVTPEEAEKLALATQDGKVNLTLRKYDDSKEVLTTGQNSFTLIGSYSNANILQAKKEPVVTATKSISTKKTGKSTTQPASVKEEKPKPQIVELIKGTKVTEIKVEGYL